MILVRFSFFFAALARCFLVAMSLRGRAGRGRAARRLGRSRGGRCGSRWRGRRGRRGAVDVRVHEQLGSDLRERVRADVERYGVDREQPAARVELPVADCDEAPYPVEKVGEAVEVAVEEQVDAIGLVRAG